CISATNHVLDPAFDKRSLAECKCSPGIVQGIKRNAARDIGLHRRHNHTSFYRVDIRWPLFDPDRSYYQSKSPQCGFSDNRCYGDEATKINHVIAHVKFSIERVFE